MAIHMIRLHRLNGQEIIINAELIESIDPVPDTIINLYTNNRYVVKESMDVVYNLILEYKRTINTPSMDNLNRSATYKKLTGKE
jgi:flagellar protein FlbD